MEQDAPRFSSAGAAADAARATANIVRLMRGYSLEATFPTESDLAVAREVLAPQTRIYLSLPPGHAPTKLVGVAASVRRCGLEPVPHITARALAGRRDADALLARLAGEAGVRRALVVAGDAAQPAGPFPDALALITSDLFERHGFVEIGITAYPDGHPTIPVGQLGPALITKLDAIYVRGLSAHIITQFGFDAAPIVAWLRRLRYLRVDVPVRIGIAGPTSARSLLRYALRCGVRTSVRGFRSGAAAHLVGESRPDALLRALSAIATLRAGSVTMHAFSFGGLVNTARWAAAAAAGEVDTSARHAGISV